MAIEIANSLVLLENYYRRSQAFNRNDPNVSPGCLKFVAIMVGAVTLLPLNRAENGLPRDFHSPSG